VLLGMSNGRSSCRGAGHREWGGHAARVVGFSKLFSYMYRVSLSGGKALNK
jgi:hypothetical protein